jgi:hypothetical protein
MANLKVRRTYGPQVEYPFVPGKYVSNQAATPDAFGAGVGASLSGLADVFQQYTQKKQAVESSSMTTAFSDWTYNLQQQLAEQRMSIPENDANYFERADAIISNAEGKFLQNVPPHLQAAFGPQIAATANDLRRAEYEFDIGVKTDFFKNQIVKVANLQAGVLEQRPEALQEAKTLLETQLANADIPELEKATLRRTTYAALEAVVYGKEKYEERSRGKAWTESNIDYLINRISSPEGGFTLASPQELRDVTVVDQTKGKKRPEPITQQTDYWARSAAASTSRMTGKKVGVIYNSGGNGMSLATWKTYPANRRKKVGKDYYIDGKLVRTGSERHDHGGSVDITLTVNGRAVRPAEDPDLYATYLKFAVASGADGVGHYEWGVHVGGGGKAAWGPDGTSKTLDPRFAKAIAAGRKIGSGAKNPKSSASGPLQFTDGTWIRYMRTQEPELYSSLSRSELLAMKKDGQQAREGAKWYLGEITKVFNQNGLPVNPTTLYLGWFLGEGDATKLLKAPKYQQASEIVQPSSLASNKSVLQGKTAGEVISWAADKMGELGAERDIDNDPRFDNVDFETRMKIIADTEQRIAQENTEKQAQLDAINAQKLNDLKVGLYDGKYGLNDIQSARQEGWLSDYNDIKAVNDILDGKMKDTEDIRNFLATVQGGSFFDKDSADHQNAVNAYGNAAIGDALQKGDWSTVTAGLLNIGDMTNGAMLPKDVVNKLESMTIGRDPMRLKQAFGVLKAVQERHPDALENLLDQSTIERLDTVSRSQISGWTEDQVDELITPNLAINDRQAREAGFKFAQETLDQWQRDGQYLSGDGKKLGNRLLDDRWLSNPSLDWRQGMELENDWKQAFKNYFITANGNVDNAKKLADAHIKRIWGVDETTGTPRLMRYPPGKQYEGRIAPENEEEVMFEQLKEMLPDYQEGDNIVLYADDFTAREVNANKERAKNGQPWEPVSYSVVQTREGDDGFLVVFASRSDNYDETGTPIPSRVTFERDEAAFKKFQTENDTQFNLNRAAKLDMEQAAKKLSIDTIGGKTMMQRLFGGKYEVDKESGKLEFVPEGSSLEKERAATKSAVKQERKRLLRESWASLSAVANGDADPTKREQARRKANELRERIMKEFSGVTIPELKTPIEERDQRGRVKK